MRYRFGAALCGAALLVSPLALAQTDPPAKALAEWGMLGTWAVNCAAPASRTNGYSSYEAEGTTGAVLRRDFGKDTPGDRSRITGAWIRGDGRLEIVIDFASINQARVNVFVKVGSDGIRAVENRGPDGSYTVRDGKFVHNGLPTLVQNRCR